MVLLGRREELLVWDQQPNTKVFEDVRSGSMTIRLQLFSYGAFCSDRYPKGLVQIVGTGLASPEWA